MHEITAIDYVSFAIRGVEIYGAFVISIVCLIAIIRQKVSGASYFLAWGIFSTMLGFGLNRAFWFNARWALEHGDKQTYDQWMAISQYPSGFAALLFFVGCALHWRTLVPYGGFPFFGFCLGAVLVAGAVIVFI
jgi:hypothetical protein